MKQPILGEQTEDQKDAAFESSEQYFRLEPPATPIDILQKMGMVEGGEENYPEGFFG